MWFKAPDSPTKARLRYEIKTLKQRLKRQSKKINTMKELVKELKRKTNIKDDLSNILEENFKDFPIHLFRNEANNKKLCTHEYRYSHMVKEFSKTVYLTPINSLESC